MDSQCIDNLKSANTLDNNFINGDQILVKNKSEEKPALCSADRPANS